MADRFPGLDPRRLDRRVLPPIARALHRLGRGAARLRFMTVMAVALSVAVLVGAVFAADRRPAADVAIGPAVRVGVLTGQTIAGYLSASRAELDALAAGRSTAESYALVTLAGYLAPDRLTPVLGGVAVAEAFARVPLVRTRTEIVRIPAFRVPGDVHSGMLTVADRKAAEAAEYERLVGQLTGDGQRETRLRDTYRSGARVAVAEAAAYRKLCSCVYAAVVRATPAALARIAARPEVRSVDPAPEVRRLDRAVFLPPLPEQSDASASPRTQE